MDLIQGNIVLEGASYFFFSEQFGKISHEIGYVKYTNKNNTDVNLGFFDSYPVTQFLLVKLYGEKIDCFVEMVEGEIFLLNNKLVILI